MTRWELITAFHKLARILFLKEHSDEKALALVREIVLDVITENIQESPMKFGAGEEKGDN